VRKGSQKSRIELFVVHRLDRETSGVMVFAKRYDLREKFAAQWKDVEKKYVAIVQGKLAEKSGIIESYLAENSDYLVSSVQDPDKGKLARTKYRVVKESRDHSLLEIELFTGKKNQIRVHLSELGHPVLGDKKYGKNPEGRLALHAVSIKFKHPLTKEDMMFETKIPDYFSKFFGGVTCFRF
jgi:tRNA pseudouridine32 synthase/23S rRNA pseudouridine746 synthase/23S rRNA pseudouridine1911/1915/1917 synthase